MSALLYIGPGLGIATIITIVIILLIILVSVGTLIWKPIKGFFGKVKSVFSRNKA